MPATLVEIANMALAEVGEQSLTTLDDPATPARLCRRFVYQAVQEVLSNGRWKAARTSAVLSRLTAVPPFGWAWSYQLPADYLRLVSFNETDTLEQDQELFEVNGRLLLADEPAASIVYIRDLSIATNDAGAMGPLLVKACYLGLALKISGPLGAGLGLRDRLAAGYAEAVREAKASDASEEFRPATNPASGSRWLASRSRGSALGS